MKKLVLLFALVGITHTTLSQSNMDMDALLNKWENINDSHLPIGYVLQEHFSEAEQQRLLAHFSSKANAQDNTTSETNSLFDVFYVMNVWSLNGNFGTLSATTPFVYQEIVNYADYLFLGDDYDDTETLYALNWVNGGQSTLARINTDTGAVTEIGPLTGMLSNHLPSGLAWNYTNNTMYAMTASLSDDGSQLYSLDLSSGALTPIGAIIDEGGLWLEISNTGIAYTTDPVTDELYRLDLTNAQLTPVGDLGINLSFAQDASFDHGSNTLYIAAYLANDESGIYTVDLDNGNATLVGSTTFTGYEFGGFTVPEPFFLGVEGVQEVQVSIFPNPAQDHIYVRVQDGVHLEGALLYDALGKEVELPMNNNAIDVSGLSQGVYFLKLETNMGTSLKRIVKQ